MSEEEAKKAIEPAVRAVVDCIAQRRYADMPAYAVLEQLSAADLEEMIDGYLALNQLTHIDAYGAVCHFKPRYEYRQMRCIPYKDGSGFHVDYDLTTDGELNDLTLQMEFLWNEAGALEARVLDAHVM